MDEIDKALQVFPASQEKCLRSIRQTLGGLVPTGEWDLSWGMPTLRINGVILMSFFGFTSHNSLFPGPEVHAILGSALDGYTTTKGTIHIDRDTPPKKAFLKAVVEARIQVINDSYPKKSGEFLEFYSTGALKATGKYRGDQMHGAWSFYRKDGSLMRQGSFTHGAQTGEWTTFTADGSAHKTTTFS